MVQQYTVKSAEIYNGVMGTVYNGEGVEIGRFMRVGELSWQARHSCRHAGGMFPDTQSAIEHIIAIDLKIEAEFAGQVEVTAQVVAA